jgi:hypothetical protein
MAAGVRCADHAIPLCPQVLAPTSATAETTLCSSLVDLKSRSLCSYLLYNFNENSDIYIYIYYDSLIANSKGNEHFTDLNVDDGIVTKWTVNTVKRVRVLQLDWMAKVPFQRRIFVDMLVKL